MHIFGNTCREKNNETLTHTDIWICLFMFLTDCDETASPSSAPITRSPTLEPSVAPTPYPTFAVTENPTETPTGSPVVTEDPTFPPTLVPTSSPSETATEAPTLQPSVEPTTGMPSSSPTRIFTCDAAEYGCNPDNGNGSGNSPNHRLICGYGGNGNEGDLESRCVPLTGNRPQGDDEYCGCCIFEPGK